MQRNRRNWLKAVTLLAAAPLIGAAASEKNNVVKMTAQRFRFFPNEVRLKAGREYILEISSVDFIHGFNLPDLKKRTDLVPGIVTKVSVKFEKPGTYDFLCDNFCGEGHEEMAGKFLVGS